MQSKTRNNHLHLGSSTPISKLIIRLGKLFGGGRQRSKVVIVLPTPADHAIGHTSWLQKQTPPPWLLKMAQKLVIHMGLLLADRENNSKYPTASADQLKLILFNLIESQKAALLLCLLGMVSKLVIDLLLAGS